MWGPGYAKFNKVEKVLQLLVRLLLLPSPHPLHRPWSCSPLQPYLPPSCLTLPLKPPPLLFLVLLIIHHMHPLCYIHDALPTFSLTYVKLTCSLQSHPLPSHSTLVPHPPTPLLPSCPTHWSLFYLFKCSPPVSSSRQ